MLTQSGEVFEVETRKMYLIDNDVNMSAFSPDTGNLDLNAETRRSNGWQISLIDIFEASARGTVSRLLPNIDYC